jgi:hypothetical protein
VTVSYEMRFQLLEKRCDALQGEVDSLQLQLIEVLEDLVLCDDRRALLQKALVFLAMALPMATKLRFVNTLALLVKEDGPTTDRSKQYLDILHLMEKIESVNS